MPCSVAGYPALSIAGNSSLGSFVPGSFVQHREKTSLVHSKSRSPAQWVNLVLVVSFSVASLGIAVKNSVVLSSPCH